MKSQYNTDYFNDLLNNKKGSKKQVAVYLDDSKIERIDRLTKIFSSISDSKSFSRNTFIEEAINKYISESEQYLKEVQNIDLNALIEEELAQKYDTVILSSTGRGFEETFLGEIEDKCWYPCRISNSREANLKYIAIYRGQPVSAITHYAKIKKIVYDENKGCKVCHFEGEPIELPQKVILGAKDTCFFIGAKYTSLENLLNVTKADELSFY